MKLNRLIYLAIFWLCCMVSTMSQAVNGSASESAQSPQTSENTFIVEQQLFLEAEKAVKNRQWQKVDSLKSQLSEYPLISYLERDQLLSKLELSNSDAIEAFLNEHGNLPVAKKLRYKWLYWLAKHNHSSLFLRHYRDFGSRHLQCKQLEFRLRTSESREDIFSQTQKIWLTGRSLPKACDPLMAIWTKAGQLTDDLIWQRMLLAHKAKQKNLIQFLTKKLSPPNQQAGELLLKIRQKPQLLAKIKFKAPLSSRAIDIINIGLNKLAWLDPASAIETWQHLGNKYQLHEGFPEVKRAISLSLAIEKDPKAASWLSSLPKKQDDSVKQWLLSTAIHEQNWSLIAQLSREFSGNKPHDDNKWIYWQAVAETQLGDLDKAQALFASIADSRSYYGFLAARQLGQQPDLQHQAIDFSEQELDTLMQHPAARRAKAFLALDRLNDARREWNYLVRNTPHDDQIKLALIAHRWQWQHQAILAFARSKQINDVEKRFPLHHFNQFSEQAKHNQIPLSWAYAITRQESAFKQDAVSSAGARGLMQLTHSTAKQVARNRLPYRRASQLLAPDTNIKLGTAHLSKMYQSFNAHPVLATAAYNAGKRKVQEWLQNSKTQDAIQWIEQIPYKETREYVKNVLTYQLIYARLTNQQDDFIAKIDSYPILNNHTATTSR